MNKKSFTICLCISLFFFVIHSPIFAEKIIFSANSMTGKTGDTSSTTELKGNSYILTETIEINADNITLSGDDYRFIEATGKVKGKNLETKMEFSADTLNFDRTTKIAKLIGNVELIDTENSVKAKAQRIEYNQDKEIAILQIEVNLTQKENECSGAYAIYHKKQQILELSGNAQVKQKKDTFRAQNIYFNMDTEEIKLGGNVKGSVTDTKESKPQEQQELSSTNNDNSKNAKTKTTEKKLDQNNTTQENSKEETKIQENKNADSEKIEEHKQIEPSETQEQKD